MQMTLKALRVNKNMRQTDVAIEMGVDPTTIASWESGKSSPKATYLIKLCELYGCKIDDIFLPVKSN